MKLIAIVNRHSVLVIFLLYLMFFGIAGLHLGGDGSPDLRIYHRYNGFVAAMGERPGDIAPAQLQTFFYPGLDASYYRLTVALNDWPRVLHLLMALPYAFATFLIFLVGRRVIPAEWPRRNWLAGCAALFGTTGAAAFATIGTTMSEIVPGLPFILGMAMWFVHLSRRPAGKGAPLIVLIAGALCGITVGIKLTTVPLFVGMFVAVMVAEWPHAKRAVTAGFLFGLAGVIATFLITGPHWLHNYELTGNPIFPAYNDLFKSDWVDPGRWTDDRFKPLDLPSILLYPATWAFAKSHRAIELYMRDPRMLFGLIAVAALALKLFRGGFTDRLRPSTRMSMLLAIFFFVSFVLWQVQFSIYRYLAIVESFSGVLIVGAAAAWTRPLPRAALRTGWLLVLLGVFTVMITKYPWWERSKPAAHAVEVTLPAMPDGVMVIVLDPAALSYIAPELPPGARLIAANGNLVRPGVRGTLLPRIEAAVREHQGAIWGTEDLNNREGDADRTLQHLGLRRTGECGPITSNIDSTPLKACRLEKAGAS